MATSLTRGDTSLTTRSPNRISPAVISSRPATIRSAVVLPQPDGPTSTTNSPSSIVRLRSRTASLSLPYALLTWTNWISAMSASHSAGRQPKGDLALDEQEEHDDGHGAQ